LKRTRFDVADVVREVAEQVAPLVDGKPVEVRLDLPDEPLLIEADRNMLRQVVMNLLSNGIKYTDAGTVTVAAGTGADDRRGSEFTIVLPLQEPPTKNGTERMDRTKKTAESKDGDFCPPSSPSSSSSPSYSGGIKVLCVDDEPSILQFLQMTFEDAGYNVLL